MFRTSKISVTSFFFEPNPPTCLVKTLDNHILVRPPNMGGKLREMRSYQPKQYLCTCPILADNFAGTKNIVTNFSVDEYANIIAHLGYEHIYLSGCKNWQQNSTKGALANRICVCVNLYLLNMDGFTCTKHAMNFFFDVFVLKYDWTFYRYACLPVLSYFLVKKLAR